MNVSAAKKHNHRFAKRSGAHVFAEALKRHGVESLFGQSIPSALYLVAPEYGLKQIAYRTENAGAIMADGYARISNKVAVVTCQNGPAATLLVPGLAEALKASIPIVAIVQDVHSKNTDRNAFQELDHLSLFSGVAKWIRRIPDPSRINDYVDMAFTAAASGKPGPAVLIVPIDYFEEEASSVQAPITKERIQNLGVYPLDRYVSDDSLIDKAAELIANAERPIIIAGGGVHSSMAVTELSKVQEKYSIPVATTTMGKGSVDENHSLSVGVVGYFMGKGGVARYQKSLVTDADLIILIGNRTNQNGTDSWRLYPSSATYIQIDIDGQEIGRNYEASVRLVGDARETLKALDQALSTKDLSKRNSARIEIEKQIERGKKQYLDEAVLNLKSNASPLRPERIVYEISKHVDNNTILVADASYSSIWITNYIRTARAGSRFITPRGLAGLGWGLPLAIGARVADQDANIICLAGDGGFGHVWSELETARRMNLDLTLVVLNNGILGYQEHAEDLLYGDHTDACRFVEVDHAAIARAVGCYGVQVKTASELEQALINAKNQLGINVIDALTDPLAFPPVTMFDNKY
jgi:acetolactate synthase-1/2/3 large subunit